MPLIEVTGPGHGLAAFAAHCAVRIRAITALAIGQGHLHRLTDHTGATVLYFETGSGCRTTAQSFNNADADTGGTSLVNFNANDFIIFSHWDEDHWWQAIRNPGTGDRFTIRANSAQGATIIAPRQHMSPTSQQALNDLVGGGSNVHIWSFGFLPLPPGAVPPANITIATQRGSLYLERGTGDPTQVGERNESGIVMTVLDTSGARNERIGLPADCQHRYMPVGSPAAAPGDPIHFTAPHHGSRHGLHDPSIPRPPGAGVMVAPPVAPTVVISAGIPNHYGHPTAEAVAAYGAGGTAIPVRDMSSHGQPNSGGFL